MSNACHLWLGKSSFMDIFNSYLLWPQITSVEDYSLLSFEIHDMKTYLTAEEAPADMEQSRTMKQYANF